MKHGDAACGRLKDAVEMTIMFPVHEDKGSKFIVIVIVIAIARLHASGSNARDVDHSNESI